MITSVITAISTAISTAMSNDASEQPEYEFEDDYGPSSATSFGSVGNYYLTYDELGGFDIADDASETEDSDSDFYFRSPLEGLLAITTRDRTRRCLDILSKRMTTGNDELLEALQDKGGVPFYCSSLNPTLNFAKLYPIDIEIGRLPFPVLVPEKHRRNVAFYCVIKEPIELIVSGGILQNILPYLRRES